MPRPIAVIDVGTSSVRMAIAEILDDNSLHPLESLSQGLSLGKDTFARGSISRASTEEAVQVLRTFRSKLEEYGVDVPNGVRVVATSAVREAANRLAFLDRIFIATGLPIEGIDEAEVHRITYRGVRPLLAEDGPLGQSNVLVNEAGGGSTELLLFSGGNVVHARSLRLGGLRLRTRLQSLTGNPKRFREELGRQIQHGTSELLDDFSDAPPDTLLSMGGDIRFAARELLGDYDPDTVARVSVDDLATLAEDILALSDDQIVKRYRRTFPEAITLGAALLADLEIAKLFGLNEILVSGSSLRDGLLREMAAGDGWSEDFRRQILVSSRALGRQYDFDEGYAEHVATLAGQLFRGLAHEHLLGDRYETLLQTAALLHEIGHFISTSSAHKHSMYVIQHSDLFGLPEVDKQLVALTARYHRRSSPKSRHAVYGTLPRRDRAAVIKMASILRVAIALNAGRDGRVEHIECEPQRDRIVVRVAGRSDLMTEQLALNASGNLFQSTFGRPVHLRAD